MLVNATEMLIKARDGHYGVPQFNINNLEWTKSVLTACEEMKSPVILGVSEGAGKYMTGFKTVAAMVSAMVDSMGITVPVALHLDHGTYAVSDTHLDVYKRQDQWCGVRGRLPRQGQRPAACPCTGSGTEGPLGATEPPDEGS